MTLRRIRCQSVCETRWRSVVLLFVLLQDTVFGAEGPGDRFLREYCMDCHDTGDRAGDREFASLLSGPVTAEHEYRWQEIVDQLTLGAMPPEDAPQPSDDQRVQAIEQYTEQIARLRENSTRTSHPITLRRLSQREYRNTVGDLLGIEMTMFDPTREFPADNLHQHFDNNGQALVTSGALLEKYLEAADRCVEKAFAACETHAPQVWTFRDNFPQQQELRSAHQYAFKNRYLVLYDHPLNDKPEGAYGALLDFKNGVPCDGVYEIQVQAEALHRDTPYGQQAVAIGLDEPFRMGIRSGNTAISDLVHTQPIEPLLAERNIADDKLEWYTFQIPLDRGHTPRFTFENGQHDVRNAYQRVFRHHLETIPEEFRKSKGIVEWRNTVLKHGTMPQIRIHEVRIRGPLDQQTGRDQRQRLWGGDTFDAERVPELLRRFADRAYRRPATEAEVSGLVALYESRRSDGRESLDAYKDALKAALCAPSFLYFSPILNDANDPRLSQHALAERLSYFLTSSMPDQRLRSLADQGQLSDPAVVRDETQRLLGDEASNRFIADFLDSWLNLRALGTMPPDPKESRIYYSAGLEAEMKRETQLFLRDLIDRDASVLELLRGDYSFANRDLAKLYGVADQVPVERAAEFHRVVFDDPRRGGLLGQASVLTVSANGIETSPVIRGIWLLENILGTPPPPPPDVVPAFEPDVRGTKSIREQLEKHRESAACNLCHRKIDPLGFALEGYDPIGRTREYYDRQNRLKIDTSGVLPGGAAFAGPAELKSLLLQRREFFVRTVTSRLLTQAIGRPLGVADRGALDRIVQRTANREYPLRSLITEIVLSDLFQTTSF